jgi:hypothetical protein
MLSEGAPVYIPAKTCQLEVDGETGQMRRYGDEAGYNAWTTQVGPSSSRSRPA